MRASDFLGDTTLAKILGKHNFTGLYERNTVIKSSINFAEFATTGQYNLDNNRNDATHVPSTDQLGQSRSFEWLVYLGPSLLNNTTKGLGTNLANIQAVIAPPSSQTALNFDARWNKPNLDWNALNESWKQTDGSYVTPTGVVAANTVSTLPDGTHVAPGYVNPVAALPATSILRRPTRISIPSTATPSSVPRSIIQPIIKDGLRSRFLG